MTEANQRIANVNLIDDNIELFPVLHKLLEIHTFHCGYRKVNIPIVKDAQEMGEMNVVEMEEIALSTCNNLNIQISYVRSCSF